MTHVVVEPWLDQANAAGAERRNADGDAKSDPAASGHKAAQERKQAALAIFRNETLRRGSEPEVDAPVRAAAPRSRHRHRCRTGSCPSSARTSPASRMRARALATRIRNTVPARRCTRRCSASSSRALNRDHAFGSVKRGGKRDASCELVTAKQASAVARSGFGRGCEEEAVARKR